jgi:hypothetical protein
LDDDGDLGTPMKAGRILLLFSGMALLAYAAVFLFDPTVLGGLVGLSFDSADARIEIRAFYGGFELGLGLFLLQAARAPHWTRVGLAAFALVFGAAGLARAWGLAEFGGTGAAQQVVAAIEIGAAAFAAGFARALPRFPHPS